MSDFSLRDYVLMTLGTGLGDLPLSEEDYLDPIEPEVTYDPAAYLEEELLAEHLEARLDALRILRFAKQRGFTRNRALVEAFGLRTQEVNHQALALFDELLAVVTPEEITAYLESQENRQQPRARGKLSRAEWSVRIANMGERLTLENPGPVALVQLLMGVIVDEQLNIADMSLSTLAGVTLALIEHATVLLPVRQVNSAGRPVYSAEEIAEFYGVEIEDVHQMLDAFAEESGPSPVSVAPIHPLH